MTNEEAYKWLYVHFAPCGDETKQDEAVNVALNALAKQIPKNPVVNGDRNEVWTKDSLICPVCNQYFGSVYNVGYCRACGQKLIQKRISVV